MCSGVISSPRGSVIHWLQRILMKLAMEANGPQTGHSVQSACAKHDCPLTYIATYLRTFSHFIVSFDDFLCRVINHLENKEYTKRVSTPRCRTLCLRRKSAFRVSMTLTFWPLTLKSFSAILSHMPDFIAIPPLSIELERHAKWVLTKNGRTEHRAEAWQCIRIHYASSRHNNWQGRN